VVIAVNAPHRAAAFAACEWAIRELKRTVPIWKKEIFEDGEIWVEGRPHSRNPEKQAVMKSAQTNEKQRGKPPFPIIRDDQVALHFD
jgi:hypothetical protein